MANNYTYPRVNISTTTLKHSSVAPETADTTILFAPILAKKGVVNKIVKIHSLEEFTNTFGLETERGMLRTSINIANWLTAGGTVYAYRMATDSSSKAILKNAESSETAEATVKEVGSYANNFVLDINIIHSSVDEITGKTCSTVLCVLKDGTSRIESFRTVLTIGSKTPTAVSSEYIESIKVDSISENESSAKKIVLDKRTLGSDGYTSLETALNSFYGESGKCSEVLADKLVTPVDVIMDAGYSLDIKKDIAKFVSRHDADGNYRDIVPDVLRDDIRVFLDTYVADSEDSDVDVCSATTDTGSAIEGIAKDSNVFVYGQSSLVENTIGSDSSDIECGASYFLSQLVPSIDLQYGIQYAAAGRRRAALSGLKELHPELTPADKEDYFENQVNYIERDSRGYYFMTQRTFEKQSVDSYTGLSFINNSRVLCRMVHDLTELGRDYLYEFNDSITLSNMSSVLNKYVTEWISNRTLSYGTVVVSKSSYSDEAVNVQLNIKFQGTIEVISIDIIVE